MREPTRIGRLDPSRRAALVHLQVISSSDTIATLTTLVSAIQHGGPGVVPAVAKGLAATQVLDIEFWMRAAVPIADNDPDRIAANQNAQLLKSLIELMDHADPGVVNGVRHVLSPMHADAMLPRISKLRGRSRRRIGRVILMIDPDAVNRVRDALRHPVLKHRLEAITMADSLAMVDLLLDSFTHISSDDHQQARIRAAEAMGRASSPETAELLESMVRLPESSVRDAAEKALQQRKDQNQKTRAAGR
jgi:HEAT repeat protein